MATSETTSSEYIVHHLTHLVNKPQEGLLDFSVIHYDTLFFSILTGLIVVFFLRAVARKATSGVPGRLQAFVEMATEMVADQAKAIVHNENSRRFVAPLALTVFFWVALMNAIDLLPVDWFPSLAALVGIHYMRPLPTADLNATLGMSLGVLLLMLYYNFKIKGAGGFLHELFSAPFGAHPLLWIPNILLNIIEFISKAVSLGAIISCKSWKISPALKTPACRAPLSPCAPAPLMRRALQHGRRAKPGCRFWMPACAIWQPRVG